MMKSKYKIAPILLTSVFLGFLLASQVSIGTSIPREILSFQNYQQVSSEIRKLTDEINILGEKKEEIEQDLVRFENSGQSDSQMLDKLSGDMSKYEYYSGLTDVEGPGVVIYLADNPIQGDYNVPNEVIESTIIHDWYIRDIVWELKNAGAEAISVNDQRVVSDTEFKCQGPVIWINNTGFASPYVIKAIGDPEALAFTLNDPENMYKYLENNLLIVNFRKEDSIRIKKYDGRIESAFMKPAQDNN